jgi:hypothetical protein
MVSESFLLYSTILILPSSERWATARLRLDVSYFKSQIETVEHPASCVRVSKPLGACLLWLRSSMALSHFCLSPPLKGSRSDGVKARSPSAIHLIHNHKRARRGLTINIVNRRCSTSKYAADRETSKRQKNGGSFINAPSAKFQLATGTGRQVLT